jgi:hypothetical protein
VTAQRSPIAARFLLVAAAVALAACGGDSGSDSAPTDTPPQPDPTIRVVESPTADSCSAIPVPQALEEGTAQTIRGTVVGTSIAEDQRGRSIILELGAEGGSEAYAVGIPESAAANFMEPPQETYSGKQVCVHGTVIDHQGVPTIFVSMPGEIRTEDSRE